MKNIIHIYGASGSGTTTLGKRLSEVLGYKFMDTDDYYWMPTNPKFTTKRDVNERIELMQNDIESADNVVISGSLTGWGDVFIPYFTLVIRLKTATDLRIQRIKIREREHFGRRIDKGGDMYLNHLDFIEYAKSYDNGDVSIRSKACHDKWEKLLQCKQIILNGADDLNKNIEIIKREITT